MSERVYCVNCQGWRRRDPERPYRCKDCHLKLKIRKEERMVGEEADSRPVVTLRLSRR